MKKILPVLLLACLLLSACSLISPNAPAATPVPATTAEPVPVSAPEPSIVPTPEPVVIYDAYYEAGTYYDDISNRYDYVLRIPAILASGTDATRLNQQVFTALYPGVMDAKSCMDQGCSMMVNRVDYEVHVNGQLISIVSQISTDWHFDTFYVVNYDAATLSEVTRPQLLQRFGLTEDQFLAAATAAMEDHFKQSYSAVGFDSMYQEQHDKSVAPENFGSDCQLFVDDNGQLCMIVKVYSLAGADYYYRTIAVK